jgi:hypothetical protein
VCVYGLRRSTGCLPVVNGFSTFVWFVHMRMYGVHLQMCVCVCVCVHGTSDTWAVLTKTQTLNFGKNMLITVYEYSTSAKYWSQHQDIQYYTIHSQSILCAKSVIWCGACVKIMVLAHHTQIYINTFTQFHVHVQCSSVKYWVYSAPPYPWSIPSITQIH